MKVWTVVAFVILSCFNTGCGLSKYGSIRHSVAVTNSMSPTIEIGDHLGASGLKNNDLFPIKRFDIVLYKHPPDPKRGIDDSTLFTHRIIGLGGEKVELKNGVVYINDAPLDESSFERYPADRNFKAVVIPENEYFILGDNRPNSEDSRYIGTVKRENIDSVVTTIIRKADYDNGKRW
jgi:signal peptidase I